MTTNDLLHIQWTGSNTHNNGNPGGDGQIGDAGQGEILSPFKLFFFNNW